MPKLSYQGMHESSKPQEKSRPKINPESYPRHRTNGLIRLPRWSHDLLQMGNVHSWLKHQTKRLLMGHDPWYKRRVVDRPLGVFCDRKRPKEGRRGDIERPAKVMPSVTRTVARHLFRSSDMETGKAVER